MTARNTAALALHGLWAVLVLLTVSVLVMLAPAASTVPEPAPLPRYSESSPLWAVYDATVKEA